MKNLVFAITLSMALVGCFREMPSDRSPIHLNQNMDDQEKFEPYEANPLFHDGSSMRHPVEGTIARGDLIQDVVFETGKTPAGSLVFKNPVKVTTEVMERGQQRYNIYCRPCHGAVGDGKGIVYERGKTQGFIQPTSFHSKLQRNQPDGHFFDVMTNGIRNMSSYEYQVTTEDRWAIVHYIRALQRSQNAQIKDVPKAIRNKVN